MKKLIALTFAFVPLQEIFAQERSTQLDPVVVSGNLQPERLSSAGRNIQVIEHSEIMRMPAASLDEILRYLPGVEVQSRGPLGAQGDFSLRGATFQQVLVILDGVRLNDPLTGHFSSYIPIAPSDIERIEILKGASSALFGTEAVGGVINIITRSFSAREAANGSSASAELSAGEFGLLKNRAGAELQKNNFFLNGTFLQNKTDGQQLRGARSFLDMKTLSISAGKQFSENTRLSLRYSRDKRFFNAQNFYSQLLSDTASETVSTDWLQAAFSHEKNRHQLRLDAAYKRAEDEFRFNRLSTANLNNSSMAQARFTHHFRISESAGLSSGIQWISRGISSNNRGNHLLQYGAIFLVYDHTFGGNFHLSPSARAEFNERSGWEINPQIQVSWKKNQLKWRASAGRSTREADFTERFNNYQAAFVKKGGRIGNPDLKSEQAWNAEAGADWFASGNWRISGSGFIRFHRNLIDYETTSYKDMPRKVNLDSTGTFILAGNIASVQTRGLELDLNYAKNFSELHRLNASAGMVLMESISDGKTPGLYVSNHARFLGNFNLMWQFKAIGISAGGIYKFRNQQSAAGLVPLSPDYFMMNARVDLKLKGDLAIFYLQADNVLDKKYADILGPQMPGRWISAGIRLQTGK